MLLPTLLACTGCFDMLSRYRYPHGDWLLWGIALWALAVIVVRSQGSAHPDDAAKWLPGFAVVILVVLAVAVLTLTIRMLLPVLAIVWGISLIIALINESGQKRLLHFLGLVLIPIVWLASTITFHTASHQVAWLGRMPPHANWNAAPVDWVIRHGDDAGPLAIAEFRGLTTKANDEIWFDDFRRISVLARTIGRIGGDSACDTLSKAAIEWSPDGDDRVIQHAVAAVVLSTALACGEDSVGPLRVIWNADSAESGLYARQLAAGLGLIMCQDPETSIDQISAECSLLWKKSGDDGDRALQEIVRLIHSMAEGDSTSDITFDEVIDELYPVIHPHDR